MARSSPLEPLSHIVGAERGDGTSLTLYIREDNGVRSFPAVHAPWILTSRSSLPPGTPPPASVKEMSGALPLRYLVTFNSWSEVWTCVRSFLDIESTLRGHRVHSYAELPHLFFLSDAVDQWLVSTGSSFFSELPDERISRCTLAFATEKGRPHLPDADRPDAAIRQVSLSTGGGEMTSFRIRKKDERALLKDVFIFIRDLDPDLICGTELRTVYLPYLQKRCAIHGIEPTLGRGEGLLRQQTSSLFRESHEIPGRTIVDLMDVVLHPELLALYGFFRRAGGYDLSPSDPILSTIRSILEREPAERVKVMDQMIEEVARTIIPIMRQTPLTPTLILQTNASTRTEATTIGRSISVHSSLPEAGPSTHTPAVHEAPYQTGVFSTVLELILSPVSVSAFARSSGNAEAADDQTAVPGLSSLQQEAASSAAGGFADLSPGRFDVLHGAVQSSLSRQSRFYLASFAPELVRLQQEVIDEAERALGLHNILVLQQTDDTLICQIPDNARASLTAFLGKVQQDLPYGLRAIVLDTFDVCVSLGPRLFALRTGNRIVSHRRARIPRFFEPFLKEFFSRSLECCLHNDWTGLRRTYIQTLRSIQRHSWHVLDFARQETLAESLEHYDTLVKAGKRNPSAAYESIRTTNPEARAGTTVRYYITGIRKEVTQAEHCKLSDEWDSADPDENTEYYMDRLAQCVERFRILFDVNGFSRIFGGEDLFGFDPDQIHTVQRSSGLSDEARSTREDDRTISLDLGDPS